MAQYLVNARSRPPHSKTGPARVTPTARDKIFEVASKLFYERGIQAVGVEEIVSTAGVAKISLYRSFPSKDDLVVAWLERRGADFWVSWDQLLTEHRGDPRKQIRVLIGHLTQRTTQRGYLGCPFLKFCCEFPSGSHPGRAAAERAKFEMRKRLRLIAAELGVSDPDALGDGLMLLIEGAYGVSQSMSGKASPAKSLPWAADALVEAAVRHF